MSAVWSETSTLASDEREAVLAYLDGLERNLGREPIDGSFRRAIAHGGEGHHWRLDVFDRAAEARRDATGSAAVTRTAKGYAYATVSDVPTVEMAGGGFDPDLLTALLGRHAAVEWWLRDDAPCGAGGEVLRTLHYMTVDLPVQVKPLPEGFTVRAFRPGRDEAAWVEQNNRAFATHPDQGGWTQYHLAERMREPWFDPAGFLLIEQAGRLAASCWTREHCRADGERLGEIHVISVDPDQQGRGLGAVAVTLGLDHLWRAGITKAMLYVDGASTAAVALYRRLGFETARCDRLVRFTRPASGGETT